MASRQKGLVTRSQLLRVGISRDAIKRRLRIGVLWRQYPGVYRVGHRAPNTEVLYLAAVLACGQRAQLSGPAAAYHLGLLKGAPPPPEVTARTERRVAGVRTHRAREIHPADTTTWRGIPVTSVARTLVDCAAVLPLDDLARACHEAGVRHGTTPREVEAALTRKPNAAGAPKLRRILHGEVLVTLSKLEKRFLERLGEAGLPLPATNRRVGGRRVDCHWLTPRITVELDSYRFHQSRHAWEQDRRREREARARGDEFRRYTWGDVFEAPELMLAELEALFHSGNPG